MSLLRTKIRFSLGWHAKKHLECITNVQKSLAFLLRTIINSQTNPPKELQKGASRGFTVC